VTAVPDTHDFGTGGATSTEANVYIRDPIRFLLDRPAVRLRQTTLLSVPNNAFTSCTFQTEVYDLDPDPGSADNWHSTAVNISRITAVYPGYVGLTGGVAFAANATNQRGCRWAVNGAAVDASAVLTQAVGGGNVTVVAARPIRVFLNTGDYAELQPYQNSGGALDTFVSAEYSCSLDGIWDRRS
jgi:hypothetical protein